MFGDVGTLHHVLSVALVCFLLIGCWASVKTLRRLTEWEVDGWNNLDEIGERQSIKKKEKFEKSLLGWLPLPPTPVCEMSARYTILFPWLSVLGCAVEIRMWEWAELLVIFSHFFPFFYRIIHFNWHLLISDGFGVWQPLITMVFYGCPPLPSF